MQTLNRKRAWIALAIGLTLYGINNVIANQADPDRDSLLARARAQRDAGHRLDALAICQDVLARWPNDRDARELNVGLLSDIGASMRARELAVELNPPLDARDRADLQADAASREIRWANGEPADTRQPYAEADQAVAEVRQLADDPAQPEEGRHRARLDLLGALDQAGRPDEALAVYAPMTQANLALPAYVERAAADAMLQKHRPREAAALYEDSIRQDPGPYDSAETDPRIGLMYAYLDEGETKKAYAVIDKLAADEPQWLHVAGIRAGIENPRKVDADLNAATLREYVGIPKEAYDRLSALSAEAPANAQLRRELGLAELA